MTKLCKFVSLDLAESCFSSHTKRYTEIFDFKSILLSPLHHGEVLSILQNANKKINKCKIYLPDNIFYKEDNMLFCLRF